MQGGAEVTGVGGIYINCCDATLNLLEGLISFENSRDDKHRFLKHAVLAKL